MLSDDVLLNIFRHYLYAFPQLWPTLTHVDSRWRRTMLNSPQGLHLRLYCTYGTPVLKNLEYWPPFPLAVNYGGSPMSNPPVPEDEENIMAALEQSDRVASISLTVTNLLLRNLSTMSELFTELEEPILLSRDYVQLTFPNAFQSGPRFRTLQLTRIAIPALPQLLSPSTGIVDLQLHEIPNVGYFSPEMFANALSEINLKHFHSISFHSPLADNTSTRLHHQRDALFSLLSRALNTEEPASTWTTSWLESMRLVSEILVSHSSANPRWTLRNLADSLSG
ncbi:hypothetical protein EDB89DRAFT_239482 [Lactarius sanguifluus]|nr:hypothetical protein EDB89DRAFT_239482 [Lactarius sanguifluus]